MGSSNSNVQRYIYTAREINSRVYEVDGAIAIDLRNPLRSNKVITGHKTTFGLGQTRIGWHLSGILPISPRQNLLASRIAELTDAFMAKRRRTGGTRAQEIAENWATILARREIGESLSAIAIDLEMPYETVKTYVKLARRCLKANEEVEEVGRTF